MCTHQRCEVQVLAGQVSTCCMPVGRQLCAQVHAPPARLHTCAKHVTAQWEAGRRAHTRIVTKQPDHMTGWVTALLLKVHQRCVYLHTHMAYRALRTAVRTGAGPAFLGLLSSGSSQGSRHQPRGTTEGHHAACAQDTAAGRGGKTQALEAALFDTRSSSVAQVTTPMKWVAGGPQSKCVSCFVVLQD